MWEQGLPNLGTGENGFVGLSLAPNGQQVMATGAETDPIAAGGRCSGLTLRASYQLWNLSGTLASTRIGRRIGPGEQGVTAAHGSGYWWTGIELLCRANPRPAQRSFVQRLSWQGDTLKAWPLAPIPPNHSGRVVLAQGNKVLVAGDDQTTGGGLTRQFSLTCSDTLGNVRWRRIYTRQDTGDHCTGLAALPSGGYLLTGDAYNFNGSILTYPAQLIETDSLGRQRRRVTIMPLGPNYQYVETNFGFNNVVVLPNYGGYVLSGTADSTVAGAGFAPVRTGYVMRLDTALRVQWVYKHRPGFANPVTRSQYAFKVRLLPNNTLAVLLQDAGPFSPDTHLVQLSLQGQRLGHYVLSSNGFTNLAPFDWLWLGDGTLVLCGKALANPGVGGLPYRAYLARWDLRGTTLTAPAAVRAAGGGGGLAVFPNPATDQVRVQVGRAVAGTAFELVAVGTGAVVRRVPVPASGLLVLDVSGVAAGVYVGRVAGGGSCKVVVVH